jgi:nicotinamidase/pyrazinamidase
LTKITNSDVVSGVWVYGDGSETMRHWANTYTLLLQARGKFLTIWPEHCIIGSPGHSVVPTINDALQRWACRSGRPIHYVMKGQNLRVEMYSALQAEVHDPLDLNTGLNVELLSMLKTSDKVWPKSNKRSWCTVGFAQNVRCCIHCAGANLRSVNGSLRQSHHERHHPALGQASVQPGGAD